MDYYIVDADIKGFIDHMSHELIIRFQGLYIKYTNLLWRINKYLKANNNGRCLNVLTLWYKYVVLKETEEKCFLTVYADDFIAEFRHKLNTERYYAELKERMEKFNI